MSLSQQETEFLLYFSASGKRLIRFEEAEEYFQSKIKTANTLSRLTHKGWLQRLERSLYLIIPLEAGPERTWSENSFIIGNQLISPSAIAYWSAYRFWNWTEQLPNTVFIQTTKRKKSINIQQTEYRFISICEKHFFGVISRSLEETKIYVTDQEKTLIDSADRPDLCGGILQLYNVIKIASQSIDWRKMDQYLIHWGKSVVVKRLGFLVETAAIQIPEGILPHWQKLISKGISPLEPGFTQKGPIVTRWQIQINIDI